MAPRPGSPALAGRLGARIRALREEAGITQEQLAWETGLDKGHLSKMEAGKRMASVPVLFVLARRLGVEAADLLGVPTSRPRLALLDAARRKDRAAVYAVLRRLGLQ